MNRRIIGKTTLVIGVLSALLMLNACGSTNNTQANGTRNSRPFVNYEQIEKEYKESVAKLNWPQQYKAPATLVGESKGGQSFQLLSVRLGAPMAGHVFH